MRSNMRGEGGPPLASPLLTMPWLPALGYFACVTKPPLVEFAEQTTKHSSATSIKYRT